MTDAIPSAVTPSAVPSETDPVASLPGMGLELLLGLVSAPEGREGKRWFWLVGMRVHLGVVNKFRSIGFAVAPPGETDFMVTSAMPQGDTAQRLINTISGYLCINRSLELLRITGVGEADHRLLQAGLAALVGDPAGALGVNGDELGDFWLEGQERMLSAIARDLMCPGLGPLRLTATLRHELDSLREQEEAALIARDLDLRPVLLSANDNLPQPEVCTDPPVFDEVKTGDRVARA